MRVVRVYGRGIRVWMGVRVWTDSVVVWPTAVEVSLDLELHAANCLHTCQARYAYVECYAGRMAGE